MISLSSVVSEKQINPIRALVYGDGGIGKTTFAVSAPDSVVIQTEDIGPIPVSKFPRAEKWQDILDAVDCLIKEDHKYKTVVLDSLDWAEPLLFADICKQANVEHMEDVAYGKLYNKCPERWTELLVKLEKLQRVKGMNVILVAHHQVKTVQNPEGSDFMTVDIKLHSKSAAKIKEWVNEVLYACLETTVAEVDGKTKARTTGVRVLRTGKSPAYSAKNRHNLPPTIPLRWDAFSAAVANAQTISIEACKVQIDALAPNLPEADRERLTNAMASISTEEEWNELLNRVKSKVNS